MANIWERSTKGMSPTTKGILGIALVAGAGVLGYTIYSNIKRKKDEQQASQAAAAATTEIEAYKNQGVYATYSDSEFQNFVHILVQAMNGCGTDEDSVYSVFEKMKNEVDIRKLITAFGVQYYEPCAATQPISYLHWQFNDQAYGGDLSTWLGYDMTSSEIAHINSILQGNGVNYQF